MQLLAVRSMRLQRSVAGGVFVLVVMLMLSTSTLFAQSSSSIAQGFSSTDDNIATAALVGLQSGKAGLVELSSAATASRLVGLVSSKPLIELSNGDHGVQVVTSGLAAALVSDMNGPVKTGDKITASPIKGVGMKAIESGVVVGTAQADLDSVSTDTRTVKDKGGKEQDVHIGVIPVQVAVTFYTPTAETSSFIPPFLQAIANRITGSSVSPVRVLIAALMFIFLFVSVSVLLYSAIRSSITSIGRNPLSEGAVRKSLGQVAVTVIGVVVFVVLAIYLVLTL